MRATFFLSAYPGHCMPTLRSNKNRRNKGPVARMAASYSSDSR